MKLLFLILSLILPQVVMAQEADADPYAECAAVLASAPASQLAELSEDGTYGELTKPFETDLVGKTCSVEQVTKYMLDAGWEISSKGQRNYELVRDTSRYSYDKIQYYCLPKSPLWGLFPRKHCAGNASFFWLEDQITWVMIGQRIIFNW